MNYCIHTVQFYSLLCFNTIPSHLHFFILNALHLELILDLLDNLLHKLAEDVDLGLELISLRGSKAALLQNAIQASEFLRNVVVVLVELIEDTDVVLSILRAGSVLDIASGLLGVGSQISGVGAINKLGSDGAQGGNDTSLAVKTSTLSALSTGVLVDEVDEVLLRAAAGVGSSLLAASLEPLDGRV